MKEDRIDRYMRPVVGFMHAESSAGIVLLLSALAAIIWSNSPWSALYFHLWDHELSMNLGEYGITKTLHHWINDGLMAMFFFVVGLELKREIIAGELSDIKKAMLPLTAAIGGMVFPALIYMLFNLTGNGTNGWGIPMATDIAFALGIISILGKGVPLSLKIFLTALAIADDLGAVLVIAFFYTSDISVISLVVGALFLTVLLVANYLGVRVTLFYGLLGIGGVWLAFLASGVHATIAGVLAAMVIPARTKIDEKKFIDRLEAQIKIFHSIPPNDVGLLEPGQYDVIARIIRLTKAASTPLQNLEHQLHPWTAYLVMPLFAFANAGIELKMDALDTTLFTGVSLGVLTGLVAGKFFGVFGVCWVMIKLKVAALPTDWNWGHLCGVALLAGIGFTMSLFITTLAFTDAGLITEAKVGIFIASILSGTAGYIVLKKVSTPKLSAP